jgi:hypothetical protein
LGAVRVYYVWLKHHDYLLDFTFNSDKSDSDATLDDAKALLATIDLF